MPTAKDIAFYSDIRIVLDTAIARGGAKYQLPTKGKAIHWRQRAYTFRKLARQLAQARLGLLGVVASTPYDELELVFDAKDPSIVIIKVEREPVGQLTDMNGAPLSTEPAKKEIVDDELRLIADSLLSQHS